MKKNAPRAAHRKNGDDKRGTVSQAKSAKQNPGVPGIQDSALKKRLETKAKIGPDAFPASNKKKGASAMIFMRPPDDETARLRPSELDAAPGDPRSFLNFVDTPDIGVQLNIAPLNQDCPSETDLRRIESALASQVSRFSLPDPEIRATCANRVISIGVWPTRVPSATLADLARDRAMRNLSLLQGNLFGFFLKASLISRLAARGFDAAPKRLSSKGFPDPNGPIHLTRFFVRFGSKNNIDTIVNGFDDRPWPDVGFSVTISDTIHNDASCVTTSTTDLSDRDLILGGLSALLLGGLSFVVPLVAPAALFVLFNDLDAVLNRPDGAQEGGVGCKMLQSVPQEVPLPGNKKLTMIYQRAEVKPGGLFLGAAVFPGARQPTLQIVGPARLVVSENAQETIGIYKAQASDTFGALTVNWSASGSTIIDNRNAQTTRIHFARGNRRAGDSFQRTIQVSVSDQDGAVLSASRTVTVDVVEADDISPICRAKPWLAICQPPDVTGPGPV
jgi:hypothetical protein